MAAQTPPPCQTSYPTDRGLLLKVPEAAGALAVSCRSIWRLIGLNQLEVVRIGKSVRITKASLNAFVAKGGTTS